MPGKHKISNYLGNSVRFDAVIIEEQIVKRRVMAVMIEKNRVEMITRLLLPMHEFSGSLRFDM